MNGVTALLLLLIELAGFIPSSQGGRHGRFIGVSCN